MIVQVAPQAKLMVSPGDAAIIAARRVPLPASALLVTMMVLARAPVARAKQETPSRAP